MKQMTKSSFWCCFEGFVVIWSLFASRNVCVKFSSSFTQIHSLAAGGREVGVCFTEGWRTTHHQWLTKKGRTGLAWQIGRLAFTDGRCPHSPW